MRNFLIVLIVCFTIYSCNDRIVQLPETSNSEIVEIFDVSPIYIFYNDETGKAEFNRNNMIGSTNWLVNIDKRLTLAQVLPHLQYLREKRNKDSMHKNDKARNYFSCSNQEIQNLAFIDFTDVVFESNKGSRKAPNFPSFTFYCSANANSFDTITMTTVSEGYGVTEEYSYESLLEEIMGLLERGNVRLDLSYFSNLTFQDYISIKSQLLKIKNEKLEINNQEFIHN